MNTGFWDHQGSRVTSVCVSWKSWEENLSHPLTAKHTATDSSDEKPEGNLIPSHSCPEAKTQFLELFNNTFNIFPVLLAPTMDIWRVWNPEQLEIEDFGLQSWLTSRHVCGHVTRATCILRASVDRPWVVDDVRHCNTGEVQVKFEIFYSRLDRGLVRVRGKSDGGHVVRWGLGEHQKWKSMLCLSLTLVDMKLILTKMTQNGLIWI